MSPKTDNSEELEKVIQKLKQALAEPMPPVPTKNQHSVNVVKKNPKQLDWDYVRRIEDESDKDLTDIFPVLTSLGKMRDEVKSGSWNIPHGLLSGDATATETLEKISAMLGNTQR